MTCFHQNGLPPLFGKGIVKSNLVYLILQEARSGRMDSRDIFLALTLMGLCHSLFEDTMLMALIGGHLSGLLVARLGFALLVIFLAGRLLRRIPEQFFRRFVCSPPN